MSDDDKVKEKQRVSTKDAQRTIQTRAQNAELSAGVDAITQRDTEAAAKATRSESHSLDWYENRMAKRTTYQAQKAERKQVRSDESAKESAIIDANAEAGNTTLRESMAFRDDYSPPSYLTPAVPQGALRSSASRTDMSVGSGAIMDGAGYGYGYGYGNGYGGWGGWW